MNTAYEARLACCQAGLDECRTFLNLLVQFEASLAKGCTAEELARFTQERETQFAKLKTRLESGCCTSSPKDPHLAKLFDERLDVLREVVEQNEILKDRLWQELDDTRGQLLRCQHLKRTVQGYKPGARREPRFIDKQR